ncbi:MAG: hypothetical protein AAFN70_21215 [Planctomycetota bacterium]
MTSKIAINDEDRRAWMRWMARTGRVVFLMDALDQTSEKLQSLGEFLFRGEVRRCPVILTGRPESESGRSEVFRKPDWRTFRLKPFDRDRQTEYLGGALAEQLMPKSDAINWQSDDDELRRHQWAELLDTPLLLHLIKELFLHDGAEGLQHIHSRKDLYDRATRRLIEKGWNTIEEMRLKHVFKGDTFDEALSTIREWLGKIAFRMIAKHDFTNKLTGDRYRGLLKDQAFGADVYFRSHVPTKNVACPSTRPDDLPGRSLGVDATPSFHQPSHECDSITWFESLGGPAGLRYRHPVHRFPPSLSRSGTTRRSTP